MAAGTARKHAQRTAVRFQFLDVEHPQPVRLHDLDGADQGKIREVLVVNGVELIEFNQTKQVREFECEDAVRLQQDLEAFHKVVEVGHLCQDVVADNEVGGAAFGGKFFRHLRTEEAHQRRNPFFDGGLGDIGRRLNPEHGNALAHEVLQQIAVVAGHFGHETLLAKLEARLHLVTVFFAMLEP